MILGGSIPVTDAAVFIGRYTATTFHRRSRATE